MQKFKIKPFREGFKVWELKDMGNGYGWDDVKLSFRSLKEAEKYIEDRKRGDRDEGIS